MNIYNLYVKQKFIVACDISPFRHPGNERELLFYANGLWRARKIGKSWIKKHPIGQARIITVPCLKSETSFDKNA